MLDLIYVNYIPETVNSNVKMFTGDTKIFRTLKTKSDCEILQAGLDNLSEWSNRWCLTFNTSKCKRMHTGKDNPKFEYTMTTENNNIVLAETVQEKDLGVWISNNLKWEKQVVATQQAMVVLRSVKRAFIHFDREAINIVYNAYIRPCLEYCVQAWSPYCAKYILMLEKVQSRATKLVIGLKGFIYEERLTQLKLYRLEERRLRGDVIEAFKLLTWKKNRPRSVFNINLNNLRGHSKTLNKQQCMKLCRRRFFSQRVVDVWHSLSNDIISAPSINI